MAITIMCCKSRKYTVITDITKPMPNEKKKRRKYAIGINNTAQDKETPKTRSMTNSDTKERKLSINKLMQRLNGKIILGKYIFLIKLSLLINEPLD